MSQHIDPTPKQTSLDALSDSFSITQAVTGIGSKVASVAGGYIRVGRIIIVNLSFTINSNVDSQDTLFSLPRPSSYGVIPLANNSSGISAGIMYIRNNGECRLFQGGSANTSFVCSGAYILNAEVV